MLGEIKAGNSWMQCELEMAFTKSQSSSIAQCLYLIVNILKIGSDTCEL